MVTARRVRKNLEVVVDFGADYYVLMVSTERVCHHIHSELSAPAEVTKGVST